MESPGQLVPNFVVFCISWISQVGYLPKSEFITCTETIASYVRF